ncbi:unnamed protein product, partial [Didymodactylos carnosus]
MIMMLSNISFVLSLVLAVIGTVTLLSQQQCFNDISGVYLRRYNDIGDDYALVAYFPSGGALTIEANEKQNALRYYGDTDGFYKCNEINKKNKQLKFRGISYQQRNLSVNVIHSSVKCQGAIDDSSDRQVHCSNGIAYSQLFHIGPIDENTRRFPGPIGGKTHRKFESRRLYKHATLGDADKCYGKLAGTYIIQYDDNTFSIVAFDPLGYVISTAANSRNEDGTFNRGTSVGKWECTKPHTASGQTNYFTYFANTQTDGQKIVSSTFYMQCNSDHENCSGAQQEFYYPLQYQLMPFQKGTLLTFNGAPSAFKASRLYHHPGIKPCHHKYSGEYAIAFNRTDAPQPYATVVYSLYPSGTIYASLPTENGLPPDGNVLGVWDCNDEGKVALRRVLFDLIATDEPEPLVTSGFIKFHCGKHAGDKCTNFAHIQTGERKEDTEEEWPS